MSTQEGHTQLTRIEWGARSSAVAAIVIDKQKIVGAHLPAFLLSPNTACLLHVYCVNIAEATKLLRLPMLVIVPLLLLSLIGLRSC